VTLERLAAAFSDAVARTGAFAPAILFFATFIEYVVPPFPGDVLVILGSWYAVQGEISWPATFVSVTAGALTGAWVDYRIGAALGRRIDDRAHRRSAAAEEKVAQFEAAYRRWGGLLLLANRFLPGVRGIVFYAAGAARVPLRKVLLLGGISSALWNAALLGAGAFLARNLDELVSLVERYTRAAWLALAAVAVVVLVVRLRRRRAGPPPRAGSPAGGLREDER
jgi:membrane-associated protein